MNQTRVVKRANRRGMSGVDVVVLVLCHVMLLASILPVLGAAGPRDGPSRRLTRNVAQLKTIDQAMLLFAADHDGMRPVPGLIDRKEDLYTGTQQTGMGPEDVSKNTTAHLYSALIAMKYLKPSTLISPFERNPKITECTSYDYDAYDPAFVADLETGSNVSYAHMPLFGPRKKTMWRDTPAEPVVLLGSRGPADGIATADSFSCLYNGRWLGTVATGSGALTSSVAQAGTRITWCGLNPGDNPFNFDSSLQVLDEVIAFTTAVTDDGPVMQHD